ncbi:transposase [Slackia heliotrinireducens]|uniref:transposase n=1 Tax=Slackia heliotrinireducens TaxID=84110 RepID=UPI003314DD2D
MARTARKESQSGFYHVTARGNGRQIIFECDHDRRKMVDLIEDAKSACSITVIAWCLMDNHIHLLTRADLNQLSEAMHRIGSQYAGYFNSRTGHVGHVFQSRFNSSPIEEESHLLEAVRYIHNNPAKAGVCPVDEYFWSSYREYAGGHEGLADTSIVLGMLGGPDAFARFSKEEGAIALPYEHRTLTEEETIGVAHDALEGVLASEVKSLPKPERNACLAKLKLAGLTVRQIERLTGIGKSTIARVTL